MSAKSKLRCICGQAFVEYLLAISLTAIFCIAGIKIFSKVINKNYSNIVSVYTIPIP